MDIKKNNLNIKQNTKRAQELLVAQYYTYKEAKFWVYILFLISVIIPFGVNISLIWIKNEIAVAIISMVLIIFLIISELIRTKIVKIKEIAASIQQKFDIEVFNLKNNFNINVNWVNSYLEKYKNKDWNRKTNWYPKYQDVEHNRAVFFCQKENIEWTQELSRRFKKFLYVLLGIIIIITVLNFVFMKLTIINILSVIITALPLVTYIYSGLVKMKNDDNTLEELNKYTLIVDGLLKNNNDITIYIENLQWMIFHFRKNKYLIPDWFDKKHYINIESVEQRKAKERKSM